MKNPIVTWAAIALGRFMLGLRGMELEEVFRLFDGVVMIIEVLTVVFLLRDGRHSLGCLNSIIRIEPNSKKICPLYIPTAKAPSKQCQIKTSRGLLTRRDLPLSIPNKNTNPSLPYPTSFCQSLHTKSLLAWVFGMAAQTTIVTKTPAMIKNMPILLIMGNARLKKSTVPQQLQVMMI